MFLIIGLGNPGDKYEDTRHNIGFMVIDNLCRQLNLQLEWHKVQLNRQRQNLYFTKTSEVDSKKIILAKPLPGYMNESGKSVKALTNQFKVKLSNLIVIHDDLDLALGKIKIKTGGSSAGHHGLNSIIGNLGSTNFIRIRIGIGRPASSKMDPAVFVLKPFRKSDLEEKEFAVQNAASAAIAIVSEGPETAIRKFN